VSSNRIQEYYDEIAKDYNESRFHNSYGEFIDRQERAFLKKQLVSKGAVLNLGCGTGRFMEFCTVGLDFSEKMLTIAKKEQPEKTYFLSNADTTPFNNSQFDAIICFHVIMHLTPKETEAIFREVNRILKPGGQFIFDFPSAERRKITKYKAKNWHGGNHLNKKEVQNLISNENWQTIKKQGVLFLPIHKFPKIARSKLYGIETLLGRSPFKQYSSYLIQAIRKSEVS